MQLSDILRPEAVKVVSSTTSKKRLFQEIGEIAAATSTVEANHAIEALIERENLGPTSVGHGVALPHARMASVSEIFGVFILLEKPVDMSAHDGEPVDIVFGLFAPEEAGVEHLKALALVSRTLKDSGVRSKLRSNTNASTLYTLLTAEQSTQAA